MDRALLFNNEWDKFANSPHSLLILYNLAAFAQYNVSSKKFKLKFTCLIQQAYLRL